MSEEAKGHERIRAAARIQLERETVGRAVRVAEGFWIIATRHHPGGAQSFPEINNRCLVFELFERDEPILLVINGVERAAISEVQRVEIETGRRVRYVLSPGGG